MQFLCLFTSFMYLEHFPAIEFKIFLIASSGNIDIRILNTKYDRWANIANNPTCGIFQVQLLLSVFRYLLLSLLQLDKSDSYIQIKESFMLHQISGRTKKEKKTDTSRIEVFQYRISLSICWAA